MEQEQKRLAASDLGFMNVVWDNEPVGSMELVALCEEALGWKKSTTFTMLRKMCEKGYVKKEDSTVTSVISRSEAESAQSNLFVEQTFGGSLPRFLVSFLGDKKISDEEIKELKRLIDEHKGE